MFAVMELDLTHLSAVGEHLDACETALDDDAFSTAREALDAADVELDIVRDEYKALTDPAEKRMLAMLARVQSDRRARLAPRIPKLAVVTEGAAEPQEAEDGDEDEA